MAKGYPPEFRRRVLDLLAAGRKVADIARDLGVSDQTIYNWRKQDRIDRGLEAGLTSTELEELAKARRRIAELEAEVAVMKRSQELLKELVPPKGRFDVIAQMVSEGHAVKTCCLLLGVSQSGFYAWRERPPSARAIRHAWLTDLISQVHRESRGTYGALRIHAELTLGLEVVVGHNAVAMLMRRAGLQGLSGARRRRLVRQVPTAADLVDRQFSRDAPDELWVTDITEHPLGKERSTVAASSTPTRGGWWDGRSTPPPPRRS